AMQAAGLGYERSRSVISRRSLASPSVRDGLVEGGPVGPPPLARGAGCRSSATCRPRSPRAPPYPHVAIPAITPPSGLRRCPPAWEFSVSHSPRHNPGLLTDASAPKSTGEGGRAWVVIRAGSAWSGRFNHGHRGSRQSWRGLGTRSTPPPTSCGCLHMSVAGLTGDALL